MNQTIVTTCKYQYVFFLKNMLDCKSKERSGGMEIQRQKAALN